MTLPKRFIPVLLAAVSAACSATTQSEPAAPTPVAPAEAPVRTSVTDLAAFDAFIATRPTPDALRALYPGLVVVIPDDITTKELRMDNSRYFVELDGEGRITGGRFQ